MILNSVEGHGRLADAVWDFLQHGQGAMLFPADVEKNPAPYERLLRGIRLIKGSGGVKVSIGIDGIVEVFGAPEKLAVYFSCFRFSADEECCHHHPEYVHDADYMALGSLSVIIEADSEYAAELLGEADAL